jgi:uncharacterized protein (TIGR03083 family)
MVSKKILKEQFDAEQMDFVAAVGGLTDEQWASPSLCEGWSVRDAVIHTAWHVHLPAAPIVDLVRYKRLGAQEFYGRLIAQNADRANADLVEWLGSPARCSKPNYCELIIHPQDIRRPLGLARTIPDDHLLWFLDWCLTRFGSDNTGGDPRKRAAGVRLVATDLDWSAGDGPEVQGTGEAILMTTTGRAGVIDELSGPGVDVLARQGAALDNKAPAPTP